MVLLCSLCSFVLWTLIISDPVYETPAEIFITADRSAWPVLKHHHAARFLKNFQVHIVLCSQESDGFVSILS